MVVALLRARSVASHSRLVRQLPTPRAASSLRILLVLHGERAGELRIEVVL